MVLAAPHHSAKCEKRRERLQVLAASPPPGGVNYLSSHPFRCELCQNGDSPDLMSPFNCVSLNTNLLSEDVKILLIPGQRQHSYDATRNENGREVLVLLCLCPQRMNYLCSFSVPPCRAVCISCVSSELYPKRGWVWWSSASALGSERGQVGGAL